MKTLVTTDTHEIVRETYENPDFSAVVRETRTSLDSRRSNRRVVPALGVGRAEYCKALVLARARYGRLMDIPYTTEGIYDAASGVEPDCVAWHTALTDDNPPGPVAFSLGRDAYGAFREVVMPIDFETFDAELAEAIRATYRRVTVAKPVQVDAEEVAQAELDHDAVA